jgi:hypothetical protein
LPRRRALTGISKDLTISKTERHASASPQLLIVMTERKAAPVDSRRFQPDLAGALLPLAGASRFRFVPLRTGRRRVEREIVDG